MTPRKEYNQAAAEFLLKHKDVDPRKLAKVVVQKENEY